jgi:hypothetical protein
LDADRFDALTRTLTVASSRRRALVATLGGVLGLLGLATAQNAEAKNCKKIKNKNKRKKCLKQARCIPTCAGKQCGDDGCGGSCGSCTDPCTECTDGVCVATLLGAACSTETPPSVCVSGRCALPCQAACGATCNLCAATSASGPLILFCTGSSGGCSTLTKPCYDHDDCAANELCTRTGCPAISGTTNRCHTLCGT